MEEIIIENKYIIKKLIGKIGNILYFESINILNNKKVILTAVSFYNISEKDFKTLKLYYEALKNLKYENFVSFEEFGEINDNRILKFTKSYNRCTRNFKWLYFINEYLENSDLLINLKGYENLVKIILNLIKTLSSIHEKGIIFYNLSPFSIFYNKNSFNIKIFNTGLVLPNSFLFSFSEYTAPEIIKENSNNDERGDIYSLGVLIYFILTGEIPHKNEEKNIKKLNELKIPENFINILLRCLSTENIKRYNNLYELELDISNFLNKTNSKIKTKLINYPLRVKEIESKEEKYIISKVKEFIKQTNDKEENNKCILFYTLENNSYPFLYFLKDYFQKEINVLYIKLNPYVPFLEFYPLLDIKKFNNIEKECLEYNILKENFLNLKEKFLNRIKYENKLPFLLLIDNLEYGDEDFFSIFKYLISNILQEKSKILIIGYGIKEKKFENFLDILKEEINNKNLLIKECNNLSFDLLKDIVAQELGLETSPQKFLSLLKESTHNNPTYIHYTLLYLFREQILYKKGKEWHLKLNSIEELNLPVKNKILEKFFNVLKYEEKTFLKIISIFKENIDIGTILEANNFSKDTLINIWKFYKEKVINIDKNLNIYFPHSLFFRYLNKIDYEIDKFHIIKLINIIIKNTYYLQNNYIAKVLILNKDLLKFTSHLEDNFITLKETINIFITLGLKNNLKKVLNDYINIKKEEFHEPKELIFLGEIFYFLKNYGKALYFYKKCEEKYKDSYILFKISEILSLEKRKKEAINYLQKIKDIKTSIQEEGIYLYLKTLIEEDINEKKEIFQQISQIFKLAIKDGLNNKKIRDYYYKIILNITHEEIEEIENILQNLLKISEFYSDNYINNLLNLKLSEIYYKTAKFNETLKIYKEIIKKNKLENIYPLFQIKIKLNISYIYTILNSLKSSILILNEEKNKLKKYEDNEIKFLFHFIKAEIYKKQNNKEKAEKNYKECLEIYNLLQNNNKFLNELRLISLINLFLLFPQKNSEYKREALKNLSSQTNIWINLYVKIIYYQAIFELTQEKNIKEHIQDLENSLKDAISYNYKEIEWKIYYLIGKYHRKEGNIESSVENFKKAKTIIENIVKDLSEEDKENYLSLPEIKEISKILHILTSEITNEIHQKNILDNKVHEILQDYEKRVEKDILEELQEDISNLKKLLEINKKLNSEHDLQKLLDFIIDTAIEITEAERGFIILINQNKEKIFEVARNFEKENIPNPALEISHSITEKVIQTGIAILSIDALQDERFEGYRSVSELGLQSVLAVPLVVKEKIIGAIYIDNRFKRGVFTEKDKYLLEAFADQSAIAIQNTRLLNQIKKSKEEIEKLNKELEKANKLLSKKVEKKEKELKEVKIILDKKEKELINYKYSNIIGKSKPMIEIFKIIEKVKDKNIPVLISGESGTGKELIAKAIHYNSVRKDKNFVSENCASLSDTLLASELFGHVKGAFTGAYKDKKGLFELADGGTLFLDEIGDMSANMQANLLRVLETNVIRRVGGKNKIKVDVRIISASNKDLKKLVAEGKFREDLYYRINVVHIHLPPLRERKEDIPLLVEYFIKEYSKETNTPLRKITKQAMNFLMSYNWPGNIRELKNVLYNVLSLHEELELDKQHFIKNIKENTIQEDKDEKLKSLFSYELSIDEYARLFVLYNQHKYSDSKLAEILGFSRKTLWEKRKKWRLFKEK